MGCVEKSKVPVATMQPATTKSTMIPRGSCKRTRCKGVQLKWKGEDKRQDKKGATDLSTVANGEDVHDEGGGDGHAALVAKGLGPRVDALPPDPGALLVIVHHVPIDGIWKDEGGRSGECQQQHSQQGGDCWVRKELDNRDQEHQA